MNEFMNHWNELNSEFIYEYESVFKNILGEIVKNDSWDISVGMQFSSKLWNFD